MAIILAQLIAMNRSTFDIGVGPTRGGAGNCGAGSGRAALVYVVPFISRNMRWVGVSEAAWARARRPCWLAAG